MSNKFQLFEKAASSTWGTFIPIFCTQTLGLVLIILSIVQVFTIIDGRNDRETRQLWGEFCRDEIMNYFAPFSFKYDDAKYGCPWRARNTIFRIIIVIIMIFVNCLAEFVLFTGKWKKTIWPLLYWLNWFIFVMMFVTFVLDCDAVNTGFNTCRKNFEINGENVFDLDGQFVTLNDTDEYICQITPWIWTILIDLITSLLAFVTYKISRYYTFDERERTKSIGGIQRAIGGSKDKPKSNNNNNNNNNGDGGNNNTTTTGDVPMGMSAYDE